MAENEPLTPEKQLLKLIENPKQETIKVESAKREGKKVFSASAFMGRISFWKSTSLKRWLSLQNLTNSSLGIRQINLVLKLAVLVLSLCFAYSLVRMNSELKRASNLILEDAAAPSLAVAEDAGELKNISYFLDRIIKRNIFSIGEIQKPVAPTPAVVINSGPDDSARVKDFSLVGIAWSANPEAMIEDKKNKRTFFVRRGDPVDNSIRVVTIFKDSVILNYRGKEYELK